MYKSCGGRVMVEAENVWSRASHVNAGQLTPHIPLSKSRR